MYKLLCLVVLLVLLATPAMASDFSLRNITRQVEQINWSAAYATGPGGGAAVSLKVSSIKGYRQFLDGAWTGEKLYGGASTELPYIRTMLAIDRIGLAIWKEADLAGGIVFIRQIQ